MAIFGGKMCPFLGSFFRTLLSLYVPLVYSSHLVLRHVIHRHWMCSSLRASHNSLTRSLRSLARSSFIHFMTNSIGYTLGIVDGYLGYCDHYMNKSLPILRGTRLQAS
jgi:hypothetical protein